jgi:5'-nucleotidase / UDP-sugar diphosphatase
MYRFKPLLLTIILPVMLLISLALLIRPSVAQPVDRAEARPAISDRNDVDTQNAASPGEAPANGVYTLTVLHTNDFHAHVDQWQASGAFCPITGTGSTGCIAGSARLKTKIDEIRNTISNVLLLDAGDQFQGTLYYIQYKSDILTRTMNALGYQAMAVGNHEFDSGPGELRKLIDGVTFPVLSANIDAASEPLLAGKIKPSTVITVGGEPIGIVGLTTFDLPALSSPGPNITVTAELTALQQAVNNLQAQGINKIIGLTHTGYDVDISLAQVITGVDVIVGGHTHSFLYTPVVTQTNGDVPVGPYPTVVTAPDGSPVLIVSAYQWGRYLGDLNVSFSPTGTVTSYSGDPIYMATTIAQDPVVQGIISPTYNVPLEILRTTVIATSTGPMSLTIGSTQICRTGECELGNLVAEAILWKVNSTLPVTDQYEIAIENGGGLRAPIDQGPVAVGEVMELLPFGNAIATMELTGTHIITALESGLSRYGVSGNGRFPQVAGLHYKWDLTKPIGSRLISVTVRDKASGLFVPLNPTKLYRVVTNDFMRRGGDGYDVFKEGLNPYDFGPALDQATMDYLMSFPNATYTPFRDGRILLQGYAHLAVAHLAPFASGSGTVVLPGGGTAVTITLDSTPVLTNFVYGASTGYISVTDGVHLVQIYPGGSATPVISTNVVLSPNLYYSAIAIGDGVNQPLNLLPLLDDTTPVSGSAKVRIGHLAPFANTITGTLADVRLQNGTPVITNVVFGQVSPFYLTLLAGVYDFKITAPGGTPTLIDPLPVTLSSNSIQSVFAIGDAINQPLGIFVWPSNQQGFFLPLTKFIYLPLIRR